MVPGDDMGGGSQGFRFAEHDIGGGDRRFEQRAGLRHVAEIDQAGHFKFARRRVFGMGPAYQHILVVGVIVNDLSRQ